MGGTLSSRNVPIAAMPASEAHVVDMPVSIGGVGLRRPPSHLRPWRPRRHSFPSFLPYWLGLDIATPRPGLAWLAYRCPAHREEEPTWDAAVAGGSTLASSSPACPTAALPSLRASLSVPCVPPGLRGRMR